MILERSRRKLKTIQCMCGMLMQSVVKSDDVEEEFIWEKWMCQKCKEQVHLKWE